MKNQRVKTFIHQFKNGEQITLQVDLSKPVITFTADMIITDEVAKEYLTWRTLVVVPEILPHLSEIQLAKLALNLFA